MSDGMVMFWLALSALGVVVCGLFAGLETGFYSLNRVRLHLLSHQGDARARTLATLVAKPGAILTTLLIGTNVATNVATSAMGVVFDAQHWSHWQVVVAVALIETPLLFVFAETLPKDLFAAHADRLVYPFARPIALLQKLLTVIGVLPLITAISLVVMKTLGAKAQGQPFQPRLLVTSLVREGLGQGLLSDEQSVLVERVMSLADRKVRDEMAPWEKVVFVSVDDPPGKLWELAEHTSFSRLPALDSAGKVRGVVHLMDALLHERDRCPPIRELMQPTMFIRDSVPVRVALRQLQSRHVALAIITDEYDTPAGIVTIKDLVEPITGELTSW